MQVITAPEYNVSISDIICFLAGGITDCWNWQNKVIDILYKYNPIDFVVFNPRRVNFPIGDPIEAYKQINWEFHWLERCDIFSMYFASGNSDQPICMYELGRNLVRMQHRFPYDYMDRIIITSEDNYKRRHDVEMQSVLALNGKDIMTTPATPEEHASRIFKCYSKIRYSKIVN